MGPGLAPVYVKTLLAAATVIDLAAAVLSVAYDARTVLKRATAAEIRANHPLR